MAAAAPALKPATKPGSSDRKVLVIYTGGTIGMTENKFGALAPHKRVFEALVRTYPQLHDNALWKERVGDSNFDPSFLCLPKTKDLQHVILYYILEYTELLDSSNLTEKEWLMIGKDIMKNYDNYDGFVVLHGTDTLSYTASALSFLFENLGKAIVLTGAQIPIFEPRSDGADNFVCSLIAAGSLNIPEVIICFGSNLYRGNRTRKISADHFHAFETPNFSPLVKIGIDFDVNRPAILKPTAIEKCRFHDKMSKNVALLRMFPSVSVAVFKAFCQPPIEGVVLESYGAGNIPSNRPDLIDEIKAAVKRGVLFLNITQCHNGTVSPVYESGKQLEELGVVSGYDMTTEAALTKLAFVLSKTELKFSDKKLMMQTSLRGELTKTNVELSPNQKLEDSKLKETLAKCFNVEITRTVKDKMLYALFQYAIENSDKMVMKRMIEMGADINLQNWEGKTILFDAIMRKSRPMVEFLLENGANVHHKTRYGETPLLTAVQENDIDIIKLLMQCGGHIGSMDTKPLADLLSFAVLTGSMKKLMALRAAGVDLNITDELRHTALHKAVLVKRVDAVDYLVKRGARLDATDLLGRTPLDYAIELQHDEIIHKLRKSKDMFSAHTMK